MAWKQLLTKGTVRSGSNGRNGENGRWMPEDSIYSSEVLKLILQEERARSNRSRNEFSFVLFDLKTLRNRGESVSGFVRALSERVRAIDKVGWMEEDSLGLVLPATPSSGARILAEEILSRHDPDGRSISYTIYTYPFSMYEE